MTTNIARRQDFPHVPNDRPCDHSLSRLLQVYAVQFSQSNALDLLRVRFLVEVHLSAAQRRKHLRKSNAAGAQPASRVTGGNGTNSSHNVRSYPLAQSVARLSGLGDPLLSPLLLTGSTSRINSFKLKCQARCHGSLPKGKQHDKNCKRNFTATERFACMTMLRLDALLASRHPPAPKYEHRGLHEAPGGPHYPASLAVFLRPDARQRGPSFTTRLPDSFLSSPPDDDRQRSVRANTCQKRYMTVDA